MSPRTMKYFIMGQLLAGCVVGILTALCVGKLRAASSGNVTPPPPKEWFDNPVTITGAVFYVNYMQPCKTNITFRRGMRPFEWDECNWRLLYRATNDNQWLEVRQSGARHLIYGTEFIGGGVEGFVATINQNPRDKWAKELANALNNSAMIYSRGLAQQIINQLPPGN